MVSPSATVRALGVFIDQDLTMKTQVQQTASRCFATLRQLRSICHYIPMSIFHSLVSVLILSRLDYYNSLLIDLPLTHNQRLQPVQNAAARLIYNLRRCDHITDVLISLMDIQGGEADVSCTAWLCTTLHGVVMHMCRRHASTEQPDVPTCRLSTVGGRAFPVAGAKVWNGLPSDVTLAS